MADGATALRRGGCTAVIDSTTDGFSAAHLEQAGVRHFLFHEVLGLSRERAEPIWRHTMEQIAGNEKRPAGSRSIGCGINPHAPYSVGPWLRNVLRGDAASGFPQAWHLGETPDEEELFLRGTGSIAEFLQRRGMTPPWGSDKTVDTGFNINPVPGVTSFRFLQMDDMIDRCHVAFHGNTLKTSEASFFSGERALVHCPATLRWFQRSPAPLKDWLEAGVNVCLGTDSLASSDTLSMVDIIRTTLLDNPELSANDALRMACSNPANISFMRKAEFTGSLVTGNRADFVALETPQPVADWREALTEAGTRAALVWIEGTVA